MGLKQRYNFAVSQTDFKANVIDAAYGKPKPVMPDSFDGFDEYIAADLKWTIGRYFAPVVCVVKAGGEAVNFCKNFVAAPK